MHHYVLIKSVLSAKLTLTVIILTCTNADLMVNAKNVKLITTVNSQIPPNTLKTSYIAIPDSLKKYARHVPTPRNSAAQVIEIVGILNMLQNVIKT